MNNAAEHALVRLAATQYGVFTRADARRHGLVSDHLRRRVDAGRFVQLAPEVFAIGGSPPTWLQTMLAACRAGGPGCVASHASAAALHALDGFPAIAHDPRPFHVQVRRERGRFDLPRASHSVITHVTRALDAEDRTERFGLPCTTTARTMLDLLATHDPLDVEHALDAALRDRKVTRPELEAMLERLRTRGRRGGAVLADLLDGRDGEGPNSILERRFFRVLLQAGLPLPVSQYEVVGPNGASARLDYAYVPERIAIELDGHDGHSTRRQRERDARRGNELVLAGWLVLHFTVRMLRGSPTAVTAPIGRALRERRRRAG